MINMPQVDLQERQISQEETTTSRATTEEELAPSTVAALSLSGSSYRSRSLPSPTSMDKDDYDADLLRRTVSFKVEKNNRPTFISRSRLKEFLERNISLEHVASCWKMERNDMWFVTFQKDSESCAGNLLLEGVRFDYGLTFYIKSLGHQSTAVRIFWLPPYIRDDFLVKYFSNFGRVLRIERLNCSTDGLHHAQSGVIIVHIVFADFKRTAIPDRPRIGPYRPLVVVPGRPPLCIKCGDRGHIRQSCPLKGTVETPFVESPRMSLVNRQQQHLIDDNSRSESDLDEDVASSLQQSIDTSGGSSSSTNNSPLHLPHSPYRAKGMFDSYGSPLHQARNQHYSPNRSSSMSDDPDSRTRIPHSGSEINLFRRTMATLSETKTQGLHFPKTGNTHWKQYFSSSTIAWDVGNSPRRKKAGRMERGVSWDEEMCQSLDGGIWSSSPLESQEEITEKEDRNTDKWKEAAPVCRRHGNRARRPMSNGYLAASYSGFSDIDDTETELINNRLSKVNCYHENQEKNEEVVKLLEEPVAEGQTVE